MESRQMMDAWMNEQIDREMGRQINGGWMNQWMSGQIDDRWMHVLMDGQVDR